MQVEVDEVEEQVKIEEVHVLVQVAEWYAQGSREERERLARSFKRKIST